MKIAASDGYFHDRCSLGDCERHYCSTHRLLWRDCETVVGDIEGDRDVINGTRVIVELGDCPECERASRHRKFQRELEAA